MKSIRIGKIAGMVKKGMVIADIGTDHAFLPILLASNGIVPKAYACDISRGPLKMAEKNISAAGLQDRISVILSDGLEYVPEDTQVVVIAGMGFETVRGILEKDMKRLKNFRQIIVEVNRDTVEMRRWIAGHLYQIDDEVFIRERGHDYTAISFNARNFQTYNEIEILYGPVLMKQQNPDYLDYLRRQKDKMENILEKSDGKAPEAEEMRREIAIYNLVFGQKKDAVG